MLHIMSLRMSRTATRRDTLPELCQCAFERQACALPRCCVARTQARAQERARTYTHLPTTDVLCLDLTWRPLPLPQGPFSGQLRARKSLSTEAMSAPSKLRLAVRNEEAAARLKDLSARA